MKTKEATLIAIAVILAILTWAVVKQTNSLVEQTNSLIEVEYSRCVNEMYKVGDVCKK